VFERLGLAHVLGLVQRLEDGFHREGAVRGDRRRDLLRPLECLAVGHHVADEPDLPRLRGEDVLAGQQDVGRDRVGDLPLQSHRGAAHRVQRPTRLGDAEPCALTGDADVGALEDLGTAGDGDAFDCCDHGLRRPVGLEETAVDEAGVVAQAGLLVDRAVGVDVARHGAEVHPRREVALGAGEDRARQRVVGAQLCPRVGEQGEHREGHRVLALRPVQGEHHHRALAFDVHLSHGRSLARVP
jgi:hypothetical protein